MPGPLVIKINKIPFYFYPPLFAVPPEQVVIRDETNTERPSVIGPYSENDSVKITCTAYGGKSLALLI